MRFNSRCGIIMWVTSLVLLAVTVFFITQYSVWLLGTCFNYGSFNYLDIYIRFKKLYYCFRKPGKGLFWNNNVSN